MDPLDPDAPAAPAAPAAEDTAADAPGADDPAGEDAGADDPAGEDTGAGDTGAEGSPLLKVTDKARRKILELRASETSPERLALWLEVSGVSGGSYTYDMYFQATDDAGADDVVQGHDDLSVVIVASSADKVRGATLDLSADGSGGMVIVNPNSPTPPPARPVAAAAAGAGPDVPTADLSGEVPQRVIQVLDTQINPSIASHGGFAELVAVDDDVAYLRLSGGCQGCGMAAVTLSQGIEVAIRDLVPEIARVVDVTDHASGANPYFEAAKK